MLAFPLRSGPAAGMFETTNARGDVALAARRRVTTARANERA